MKLRTLFLFFSVLTISSLVYAKGFISEDPRVLMQESSFTTDPTENILLDDVSPAPAPIFKSQKGNCLVRNCPIVHCSLCNNEGRTCRTINCQGKEVQEWFESCPGK